MGNILTLLTTNVLFSIFVALPNPNPSAAPVCGTLYDQVPAALPRKPAGLMGIFGFPPMLEHVTVIPEVRIVFCFTVIVLSADSVVQLPSVIVHFNS